MLLFVFGPPKQDTQDLSSPTRGGTSGPLCWECGVITTGPPGKSLHFSFFKQERMSIHTQKSLSGNSSGLDFENSYLIFFKQIFSFTFYEQWILVFQLEKLDKHVLLK